MNSDESLKLLSAIGAIVLLAFCIAAIVFVPIPKEQMNLFTALAMGVVGTFGTIIGFLFGSSLGSRNKDAMLNPNPAQEPS